MTPAMRDFAIRDIGCICCLQRGIRSECEKHHLLSTGRHGNGKRLGERHTVGLCTWHHRGAAGVGTAAADQMRDRYGPSYADEAAAFREAFGDDAALLEIQDRAIAAWADSTIGGVR